MINDYEVENCDIYIIDEHETRRRVAGFAGIGGDEKNCPTDPSISLSFSNKYLAFTDVLGGVDSAVKIYSIEMDTVTTLYVYGTSSVFDIEFTYDDILAVLNGYPNTFSEQYVIFYDIEALYGNYAQNVNKDAQAPDYFKVTDEFQKTHVLPNVRRNYTSLIITSGNIVAVAEKLQGETTDRTEEVPYEEYSFKNAEPLEIPVTQ